MKRKIWFITIIGLILIVLPSLAAADIIDSGLCGTLTWTLSDDYTLTIEGEGLIPNDVHPWNDLSLGKTYNEVIQSVVIKEGVTRIGDNATYWMPQLKSVSFSNTVTSIGAHNFEICPNLTEVNLPENLVKLGCWSFARCSSLKTIQIPASLESIETSCFTENDSLVSISVDRKNKYFYSADGALVSQGGTLISYPIGNTRSTYTVPEGIESIGQSAFNGCKYISSVILPDSLARLEMYSLGNCSALTSVKLPSKLRIIYDCAFYGTNIYEITIPSSVIDIGSKSFKNDTLIKCLKGSYADTWAQENGYRIEYIQPSASVTIKGVNYLLDNVTLTASVKGAKKKSISSITIPATVNVNGYTYKVTSIDANAFKKYTKLKKVTIGKNTLSIGKNAFDSCINLKTINIKTANLNKIGSGAFKGVASDVTVKCPKKQKAAYEKLLRKSGLPDTARIK